MEPFNWTCPHCNQLQTATDQNYNETKVHIPSTKSRHGRLRVDICNSVCLNPDCQELTLVFRIRPVKLITTPNGQIPGSVGDPINSWQVIPENTAKAQPEYIPRSIVDNYRQACRIRKLSPNASATMSRRCLQGIIRNFWNIKGKRSLWNEIQTIEDKVDATTWRAIDAVREVGNIGAHLQQDVNLILDVTPDEAQTLIDLIELLFKVWYVDRHERENRSAAVVAVSQAKKTQMDAAVGRSS